MDPHVPDGYRLPITRRGFIDLMELVTERVEEDIVTMDDSRAIAAANFLRYYAVGHMTADEFKESDG